MYPVPFLPAAGATTPAFPNPAAAMAAAAAAASAAMGPRVNINPMMLGMMGGFPLPPAGMVGFAPANPSMAVPPPAAAVAAAAAAAAMQQQQQQQQKPMLSPAAQQQQQKQQQPLKGGEPQAQQALPLAATAAGYVGPGKEQ